MNEALQRIYELVNQQPDPDPVDRLKRVLKDITDSINLEIQAIEASRRAKLSENYKPKL